MTKHYNKSSEKQKRRVLRNNATKAEQILWKHLKGRQLAQHKFRRQYSVDQFVIDFYCPSIKLAIEVDGSSHFSNDAEIYDKERERIIETFGITFIRFNNNDVFTNIDGVLTNIKDNINELTTVNPLLGKEGT